MSTKVKKSIKPEKEEKEENEEIIEPYQKKIIKCKEDLTLTKDDLVILDEETEKTGVIYCISNNVNDKKYYGQTRSYRIKHGKLKYFGMKGRFNEHISDALKNKEGCSKLYNAIRKHGKDAFTCDQVLICDVNNLDDYETFYIVSEDTVNSGYNVITHNLTMREQDKKPRRDKIQASMKTKWATDQEYIDKTTAANLASLKKRAETGENRTVHKELKLPGNIYKNPDGGYDIRVIRNGVMKITSVTQKNKTDEELLELAIEKRDKIIDLFENEGVVERVIKSLDHNGEKLPQCILNFTSKGSVGYRVTVRKGDKMVDRTFAKSIWSMDKKLELANEALEMIREDFDREYAKDNDDPNGMDHRGRTLPPGIRRCKGRYAEGYRTRCKIDGKYKNFTVTDKDMTMTEKLKKVTKWLEENKDN